MNSRIANFVGAIVCIVFAIVWKVGWAEGRAMSDAFESHHGKYLPPDYMGLLLFLAAPWLRTQGRVAQRVSALGILALCGLAVRDLVAEQSAIAPLQASVWILVPLAILIWVLMGPEGDDRVRELERARQGREIPPVAIVLVISGLLLALLVLALVSFGTGWNH